jgi:inosose dehydratase
VPLMHWKDCSTPLPAERTAGLTGMERHAHMLEHFRILGAGAQVDWPAWMEVLGRAGWTGSAMAEIDMSPDPIGEIRFGIDYFDDTLAAVYDAARTRTEAS